MEARSRSSLCVQKRNENDSDISLSFSLSISLSSWNLNLPNNNYNITSRLRVYYDLTLRRQFVGVKHGALVLEHMLRYINTVIKKQNELSEFV